MHVQNIFGLYGSIYVCYPYASTYLIHNADGFFALRYAPVVHYAEYHVPT